MLSGKSIDCMVYKKKDAVLNVLEPRLYKSGYLQAAQDRLSELLNAGWELVLIGATGNVNLSAYSGDNVVVAFSIDTTSSSNFNIYEDTLDDPSNVIFFGAKCSSGGYILKLQECKFTFTYAGTYSATNLGFEFCRAEISTSGELPTHITDGTNTFINSCYLTFDDSPPYSPVVAYAKNSRIHGDTSFVGFTIFTYCENCHFSGEHANLQFIAGKNILLDGNDIGSNVLEIDEDIKNLCFINNPTISNDASGQYNLVFFYFSPAIIDSAGGGVARPALDSQKFIFGVPKIDFTDTVDFDDFVSLNCDISRTDQADSRLFGFGQENFYVMKFEPRYQVPDALKKGIGEGYYWFIRRKDFETDLDGKTIYNLGLYTAGGHTTAYDFASDENFLILAEDSSGNKAVLVWYSNQLYPTVYSDVWDGTDYEILNCFQIWEAESRTGIQNIFKDQTTSKGITNSPMGGQIRFNNLDREILIRI